MKPTRRELGAIGVSSIITASGVTALMADTAQAQVTGDFNIPEVDREIVEPVNSVRLTTEGTISWESDTPPTRAVLRLEVAHGQGSFEQLKAEAFQSGLEASHTESFTFSDVNLLDHEDLSVSDFVPEGTGNSISMTLHARLSLTVENDGTTLAESQLQESIPIGVEQVQGETTISMGATGEVTIGTSD